MLSVICTLAKDRQAFVTKSGSTGGCICDLSMFNLRMWMDPISPTRLGILAVNKDILAEFVPAAQSQG